MKYNRRVKLGCYLVNYEELEKTVPNSCFVAALLVGMGMLDKSVLLVMNWWWVEKLMS